jgi:hypothetical protein
MARGPLRVSRDGRIPNLKRPGPGTLDFALRSVRGGRRMVMEELAPRAMEFEPRPRTCRPEMAASHAMAAPVRQVGWTRRGGWLATGGVFRGNLARVVRVDECNHRLGRCLLVSECRRCVSTTITDRGTLSATTAAGQREQPAERSCSRSSHRRLGQGINVTRWGCTGLKIRASRLRPKAPTPAVSVFKI